MDRRANMVATIAPRFDPDLLASWHEYWAFQDPALARATFRIYTLDSLMPQRSSPPPRFLMSFGGRPSLVSRRPAPICWSKTSFQPRIKTNTS
jgi:hypothetical protein